MSADNVSTPCNRRSSSLMALSCAIMLLEKASKPKAKVVLYIVSTFVDYLLLTGGGAITSLDPFVPISETTPADSIDSIIRAARL